jgi:hypothetical protein
MRLRRVLTFGVGAVMAAGVIAAPLASASPRPMVHPADNCGLGGCWTICTYNGGVSVLGVQVVPPVSGPCPEPDNYVPLPAGAFLTPNYETMDPLGCCDWYLQQGAQLEFVNDDNRPREFDGNGFSSGVVPGPGAALVSGVSSLAVGNYTVYDSLNGWTLGTLHITPIGDCGAGFGAFGTGNCQIPCTNGSCTAQVDTTAPRSDEVRPEQKLR